MAPFQTFPPDGPSVKPEIVLIPRKEYRRRRGDISRSTEFRFLRADPDHPQPVNGKYYVEAEVDAYLETLAARRGGSPE
jgi:hypothetical protein